MEFLRRLLSSDGFMPHGHCYLWRPDLVWLHVISDGLVALAYTSIPFTLIYFARKRRDIPFNWMFLCFGMFIIACGATHVMEIWTLWTPVYWLSGVIKAITALASVPTAILLVRLVPKAVAMPTASQLELAHAELRRANDALETRVQERTAELVRRNEELANEVAERKRAEEALRRSEARFHRLADAGIIGIVTADTRGNILDANDMFLATVGYTHDDVRDGKVRWTDMTPPEWREHNEAAVRQLETAGVAAAWEKEYVRKDGTRVPILVGAAMLEGTDGECVAFVLDLSERKRAEREIRQLEAGRESDAKFQALLESAPDAMVIADARGRIVLVNAQTEQLFGYTRADLLGNPVELLVPARYRADHPAHRAGYVANPRVRPMMGSGNLFARRKDGTEFPVEINLSPLVTGGEVLVSSAIRDVTDRKRAEAELRHSKDLAETASRELEAFSYSVAHDLRSPLRALNGYSTALVEDLGDSLLGDSKDHLERIRASADRMGKLIDALLALARVSRVDLSRESVNLTELARAVMAGLHASEPERVVELVTEGELVAHGDPQLLRALLDNLIGNAWKFTAKHPTARIEFGRTGANYFVRDDGAGFDPEYAQKLFVPFQRLHKASDFAGTGVGLATVQRIVLRHGGKVWASSAVGRGATFYFTLE